MSPGTRVSRAAAKSAGKGGSQTSTGSRGGSRKRVLIIDDHPLLREGLAKIINQQPDLCVCCEATDVRAAFQEIPRCIPDVLLMDLTLDDMNGLDLIREIRRRNARVPILVLSMHHENLYAERAVLAGAQGYVMKHEPVGTVLAALRKVLGGHMALSESMVSRMIGVRSGKAMPHASSPVERLSDREREVFRGFGEGLDTRGIARKLRIAPSTVETHRAAIKRKLGLSNATELVARAAQEFNKS